MRMYVLTARLGNSGLKISKVVLGCMTFGTSRWQDWVLDEEKSLPIIEHAYKNGINTWDTVLHPPVLLSQARHAGS